MGERLDRDAIKVRIAQAREEAGLTQPELGDLMQPPVHFRTVQDWESLKNANVPFRQLDRIAEVTGRSTHWLLHGDTAPDQAEIADLQSARHDEILDRLNGLAEGQRLIETKVERLAPPGG